MTKFAVTPISALLGGGAAFFLRLCQNRTGFDPATALPVPGNFYALALPSLLTVCGLWLFWQSRRLPRESRAVPFGDIFTPAGTASMVVLFCGLAAILFSGFLDVFAVLFAPSPISGFSPGGRPWSGAASALAPLLPGLASVICGLCLVPVMSALHMSGRRQGMVIGGELLIPVIALVVKLVICYRNNSVNPSFSAYYPELLALVLLILAFFRLAAFAYSDGTPRRFAWYGAMAVVLCMTAAADAASVSEALFFCGMALVLITFLSLLQCPPVQTHLS